MNGLYPDINKLKSILSEFKGFESGQKKKLMNNLESTITRQPDVLESYIPYAKTIAKIKLPNLHA